MSKDWVGYDLKTLELIKADIKATMNDNRRLSIDTPQEQVIAWAHNLSGKHEVCSIITEKIKKIRGE